MHPAENKHDCGPSSVDEQISSKQARAEFCKDLESRLPSTSLVTSTAHSAVADEVGLKASFQHLP